MRLVCVLLLTISGLMAQNKQLLYDFNEVPQSLMLNPGAEIKHDVFVGIPLLSHLHVNAGSSGVSVYDLFADNGVDFNTKLGSVVANMKMTDNITFNQQLEIFSAGFKLKNTKDAFLSFGMYQETDFHMYYPKDYVDLAYYGNAGNVGRSYDLSHLNLSAEMLSVFHVGYHKKINDRLRVGGRVKLYSSIANIKSVSNKGSFVTTEGDENVYSHQFNLDLEVQTSGVASLLSDENSAVENDLNELVKRMFFGGNLGMGIDAGFAYDFLNNWTVTGSFQDFGAIYHAKDVETYKVSGNYTYNGINPLFPAIENNENDYWDTVSNEFENLFEVDTLQTKYVSWRPLKLNTSVKYTFNKERYSSEDCDCLDKGGVQTSQTEIGAHLFAVKRPRGVQPALTVYGQKKFFNFLSLRGAYTVDRYSYSNVGLGLSAKLGPLNLYVMGDNLLEYKNLAKSNSASVQLGLNFVFNQKK